MEQNSLSPNQLAFIALCNEFCRTVEHASEAERRDFVETMLRQLPRIYIAASDLTAPTLHDEDFYQEDALDEDSYEMVRRAVADLMGEDDTYLEVFEQEMRFSEAPIPANISEGLADIFQVLYNFIETVRVAPDYLVVAAIDSVREDFATYWSQKLCNTLRALNHIRYSPDF